MPTAIPRSWTARRGLAIPVLLLVAAACGDDAPTQPVPTGEPTIQSITPAVLAPGGEAVLSGGGFGSSPSAVTVRLWDAELQVLVASETSLTVRLPSSVCGPAGEAPVTVQVSGETSDAFDHPFEPIGARSLAVGEFVRIASPDDLCLILDASGGRADYLVGTQSTTEVVSAVTGVRLRGMRGATASTLGAVAAEMPDRAATAEIGVRTEASDGRAGARTTGGALPRLQAISSAHRRAEANLRLRERRLVEGLGSGTLASAKSPRAPAVPASVQVGDLLDLRVPDISTDNFCNEGRLIEARVRWVGEHSIWVEDVDNPEGGFRDEDYELLSSEFDDVIYEELVAHFGEPSDLDENGRIVIVTSHEVNRMTNAGAFVVTVDFFGAQCEGANGGEFYYTRAPDPTGEIPGPSGGTSSFSRDQALSQAPLLLAHEGTHLIQWGTRFGLSSFDGSQELWLLEGQATLAEEVVGHRYSGNEPRSNLGPDPILESYPPTGVSWYAGGFVGLFTYFGLSFSGDSPSKVTGAPHECTWLTVDEDEFAPCDSAILAYGTGWSFLRWVSDHFGDEFAEGDREIQRRIVSSPLSGFATIEDVVGADRRELLAPWAASLYADGRVVGTPDPLVTFPSWNLADVEDAFIEATHLVPADRSVGSFQTSAQVAAASSHYLLLRGIGGHPAFALSARSSDGEALPPYMQLWVVRMR